MRPVEIELHGFLRQQINEKRIVLAFIHEDERVFDIRIFLEFGAAVARANVDNGAAATGVSHMRKVLRAPG